VSKMDDDFYRTCPRCSNINGVDAIACSHCRVALIPASTKLLSNDRVIVQPSPLDMACVSCRSVDIQKVSVVYEAGVSYIDTRSAGVGIGFGGPAVGRARNRGTQKSALSLKLSPPQERKIGGQISAFVACAFFGVAFHVLWGVDIILAIVAFQRWNWNNSVFPGLLSRWEAQYMCQRCGWVGILANATSTNRVDPILIEATPIPIPIAAKTRECPSCFSEIPNAATVCRYCRRDVPTPTLDA